MTKIRGGVAGPDPAESADPITGYQAYRNEIDTQRALAWFSLGGRPGILKGFVVSPVTGQLALDLSKGAALAAERDGSGNEVDRGYLIWADTTTRVTFGGPSASARKDALVAAFVDVEDGPVGTGGLSVGAHLVAVPGTSGVSTPVPATSITAWLGRGGWARIADVAIGPNDTQISMVSVADAGSALNRRRAMNLTSQAGYSVTSASYLQQGTWTEIVVACTKGSGTISASNQGNLAPNEKVAVNVPAALRPNPTDPRVYGAFNNDGAKLGGAWLDSDGQVWLTDMYPSTSLGPGDTFTIRIAYGRDQG